MSKKGLLGLLFKFINKKYFVLGLLLSFLGAVSGLLLPQIIGQLLDAEFLSEIISNADTITALIILFILIYTVQALSSYMIASCGSSAMNKMQKYIYSHLIKSSIDSVEKYNSGDLASRLTNDMSVVLNFVTAVLPNFILNLVTIIGSVCFLLKISPSMTLLSLIILPIMLLIIIPINQRLESYYTNYQENISGISSQVSHKFNHIRLIKAFKGEEKEENIVNRSFDDLSSNFKHIIKLSAIQNTLVNSLMMALIIILLVVAGMSVSKGEMTIATLTTFVLYMTQLVDPITDMSDAVTDLSEFSSVLNRLIELINFKTEIQAYNKKELTGTSISLSDVSFSYDDEKVIANLNVTIPERKHIAIVGPSGAGKSTIFNLLMKFYDNYTGIIKIGNTNIKDLSSEQLRSFISYIPQNNSMFQGSIRDNLLYGKNSHVSDERMNQILEQLDLKRVVDSLPDGLDTNLTDSGSGLSEGQKQRFSIARALMLEHPIYLMDEITASLDNITEGIISKAIDKMTSGKTRITIAHRLHTIRNADYILVLNKDGSVSDFGEHRDILARNNFYKDYLSELQKVS